MSFSASYLLFSAFICVLVPGIPSLALNTDGILLLSFKYSVLSDPLSVLQGWNYDDQTPCSWNGVTCTEIGNPGTADMFRVTGLVLPNSQLLGSVSEDLGFIEHLRHLDLSNNFFNGSLPVSVFNATELQVFSLSNNVISGELPEIIGEMRNLQVLNLSDNALAGKVPQNLTALQNLSVVSLRSNYFSGSLPGGFSSVEVLDLSSNLFNGSLPLDFGGDSLRFLNLSYNKISGSISPEFAKQIPKNVTIDLSFNNLTGAIPQSPPLLNQRTESFAGNVQLCGKPLKNLCSIPSTLSTPPNVSSASPAIAVIPRPLDSVPVTNSQNTPPNAASQNQSSKNGLKPGTIATIAVADLAGIALLALVILYLYQIKKRKGLVNSTTTTTDSTNPEKKKQPQETILTKTEKPATWSCLTVQGEETSEATTSSDSDQDNYNNEDTKVNQRKARGGILVTVDGENELELETLFKASAYILGTSGSSIMYKAVLGDGTEFAVRRIGESGVERLKDFESQVKAIAKLKHPNLVKVRGFYWGDEEKLVIYDYVSNGSLATAGYRKAGSSPYHLPLEIRLKIARGVAKGLAYIHEKKSVHGNVKPTNILLNSNMEPLISDLGLDRLLSPSRTSSKSSNSSLLFGSQRSTLTAAYDHHPTTSSPYAPAGPSGSSTSPYQAPESLKNLKPNPKWDVFSFGIVLLELLTGRVLSEPELGQYCTASSVSEEKNRILRLVDVTIRGDVASWEDAMLACLKLGFNCASFAPQKRPSMKEALQILEKIPSNC
ncbi:receptor protein kinase-like protein At4g34220 [Pistacia vera]|uniref:receptor protein kinase-like protein At4g34220 n=1 Tax=Pistacia vera TaxID=55513 RepID=UPI00126341FC|nr:receptor protein kinase-like protein At4g34220 [Pistacia vera]